MLRSFGLHVAWSCSNLFRNLNPAILFPASGVACEKRKVRQSVSAAWVLWPRCLLIVNTSQRRNLTLLYSPALAVSAVSDSKRCTHTRNTQPWRPLQTLWQWPPPPPPRPSGRSGSGSMWAGQTSWRPRQHSARITSLFCTDCVKKRPTWAVRRWAEARPTCWFIPISDKARV